jgi:hypothetical protein
VGQFEEINISEDRKQKAKDLQDKLMAQRKIQIAKEADDRKKELEAFKNRDQPEDKQDRIKKGL